VKKTKRKAQAPQRSAVPRPELKKVSRAQVGADEKQRVPTVRGRTTRRSRTRSKTGATRNRSAAYERVAYLDGGTSRPALHALSRARAYPKQLSQHGRRHRHRAARFAAYVDSWTRLSRAP